MPFTLTNNKLRRPNTNKLVGTGWLPPMYDPRDYTAGHPTMLPLVAKLSDKLKERKAKGLKAGPPASARSARCALRLPAIGPDNTLPAIISASASNQTSNRYATVSGTQRTPRSAIQ